MRELAFYRCAAPARTLLRELVRVAGARRAIEDCFQCARCPGLITRTPPVNGPVVTGEPRTISVVGLPPSPDLGEAFFPHAAPAIKLVRRRRPLTSRKWKTVTVYAITSLTAFQADPVLLPRWNRGHWCIENRRQWVRDRSQVRTANGPQVMAALRNLAITALRLSGATSPPRSDITPATPADRSSPTPSHHDLAGAEVGLRPYLKRHGSATSCNSSFRCVTARRDGELSGLHRRQIESLTRRSRSGAPQQFHKSIPRNRPSPRYQAPAARRQLWAEAQPGCNVGD